MNKHQIKGRIREAAGEIQQHTGKLTGNKDQEMKGQAREQAGKAQKNAGDLKEDLKNVLRESGKH